MKTDAIHSHAPASPAAADREHVRAHDPGAGRSPCCTAPPPPLHERPRAHGSADCCAGPVCADPPGRARSSPAAAGTAGRLLLRIPDMDCAVEESRVRRALEGNVAIRSLRFDLGARTVTVDAAPGAWDAIRSAVETAGLKNEPLEQAACAGDAQRRQRRETCKLAAALALAAGAELVHFLAPESGAWEAASLAVAGAAIALAGLGVYRKGLAALGRGQLDVTALMMVAVTGAFLIGQWAEAAMVMALYALAELIEAQAVDRARRAVDTLLDLAPSMAEVRQRDGIWLSEPAGQVRVGSVIRVRPGERLALDGRVVAGHSAVDQAPVTGESVPVEKGPGDEAFAGTVNQHGALELEVTAPVTDTVLARIIHAVDQAQGSRAPTQRLVDRFSAVYTPAVFVIALAVALLGPWLAGWSWSTAIYRALVLLVIACPCALVISTPVTVVSGLAAAARRGILIKGGVYLEDARRLTCVALDKTGTLTEGRPRLVAREAMDAGANQACVWQLAAGLAARSDHPVSKAIAQGLAEVAGTPPEVQAFAAEAGRGTRGRIEGLDVVLGNRRWIEERGQCSPALAARMQAHERQGRSISVLADDQRVLALFAVADAVRPGAQQAVRELREMGITPIMLTGDSPVTAQAVAGEAGITEVRAGLLPRQKLEAIQAQGEKRSSFIGMVGDGINDAPALAAAQIGFAMGRAGTDTATEAADVVILNDDLRRVPETVRLSRRAHDVLRQNIALALGIKAVFLVLAVQGSATMWMAVFADMGASLLVVFNGLRLLRGKATAAAQA